MGNGEVTIDVRPTVARLPGDDSAHTQPQHSPTTPSPLQGSDDSIATHVVRIIEIISTSVQDFRTVVLRHIDITVLANMCLYCTFILMLSLSFVVHHTAVTWLIILCILLSLGATILRIFLSQGGTVPSSLEAPIRRLSQRRLDPMNFRLTLVDRDFNENDYETLLALDEADNNSLLRGASIEQIHLLPVYKIEVEEPTGDCTNEVALKPPSTPPSSTAATTTLLSTPSPSKGPHLPCSICLESFTGGDTVRTLPCLHQYHAACVDTWLVQQATCPVCKFDVF